MPSLSVEPAPRAQPVDTTTIANRNRARGSRLAIVSALVLAASVGALLAAVLVGPAHLSAGEVFGAMVRRLTGRVAEGDWPGIPWW